MSKKIGEILDKQKKPKLKIKQSPTDINITSLPFYKLATRNNDLFRWENTEKTIGIGFFKGQPSINAQRILTYFFSKIPRKKGGAIDTDDLKNNGISFTLAEICRFLGIRNETRNRRTVQEDLEKLGNITLHFHKEYLVKDNKKGVYRKAINSIGLFKVDLLDTAKNGRVSDEQLPIYKSYIKFDDLIIDNLASENYRLIETDMVNRLKSSVAVRIHGILSMHNQSKIWKIGIGKLAEQIPITANLPKHRRESIKKATEELINEGVVKSYRIYKNTQDEEIIEFTFQQ